MKKGKSYRFWSRVTVIAVYVLILVGGIVRCTGSGMGCPDWPKCFGTLIPPTSVDELPTDYKEVFKVAGKEIADFNVYHTWVEYINRLVGVLIGFFVLLTLVLSFQYWKKDKVITILSFLAFVLVGVEGWLGSKVVATDLKPTLITIHMLIALFIVGLLIYTVVRSHKESFKKVVFSNKNKANILLIIGVLLGLIQICFGTQVREQIDHVAKSLGESQREIWISHLDIWFYIHRSFSLLVLGINIGAVYLCIKSIPDHLVSLIGKYLVLVLVLEILTGVVLSYFAVPAYSQPIHLLLGSLMFGLQILMIVLLNPKVIRPNTIQS